jgi:protein HOOK3
MWHITKYFGISPVHPRTDRPVLKAALSEKDRRYRREQELLLGAIHALGMKTARQHLGAHAQYPRDDPSSWLNIQRKTV